MRFGRQARNPEGGLCQKIDGSALVKADHLDRKFDRRTRTIDAQNAPAVLSNWDDPAVNLRCELATCCHLLITGRFSLRDRRVIEIRKTNGALDLERAVAFEKHRRCVGIDPTNMRVDGGVRKKCKDTFLDA